MKKNEGEKKKDLFFRAICARVVTGEIDDALEIKVQARRAKYP